MVKIEKVIFGIILFIIFGVASSLIVSDDTFWQLLSGRYMMETKSLIRTDTFTLTFDAPRIEHCWLHDIIYYLIYSQSGYDGISLLKGLLVTLTATFLILTARSGPASVPSLLILTIPAFLLSHWAWLDRPQLWSFLAFAVLIYFIERYRKKPDRSIFYFLPVMVLWSNLHAGAILAFPVMAAYLAGEGVGLITGRSSLSRADYTRLVWLSIFMVLTTAVTPYTDFHILKALSRHVFKGGGFSGAQLPVVLRNLDWKGYSFSDYPIFAYACGVAAIIFGLGWRRFSFSHLILLLGLAFMALKGARHIPLFFFGCAAILPQYLDAVFQPVAVRFKPRMSRVFRWAVCFAGVSLVSTMVYQIYTKNGIFRTGLTEWQYPLKAVTFIQQHKLPAPLFNSRDWGGYLAWRLYPEYRVFWDARDTSQEMFVLGAQITNGDPNWHTALQDHGVKTLVIKPLEQLRGWSFGILKELAKSPYYAPVFADSFSLVFVRKDAVPRDWLRAHMLPRRVVDDTILSAADILIDDNPNRYAAYNEKFLIYNKREQHAKAFDALTMYLRLSPVRDPVGERIYRMYSSAIEKSRGKGKLKVK